MFSRRRPLSILGLLSLSFSWSCSDDTETHWAFHFDSHTGTSETHVLVTDSPADGLEAFHLGIDSLRLHRDDGESVVLVRPESAFRTELLALRPRAGQRFFEVLAAGVDLAPGRYDRVSIVLRDPVGQLPDGETLNIESSGPEATTEIELDLEEPIEIRSAHTHYIVVDVDVDRSLVDDDRGVLFRPVVLIEDYADRLPDDARTSLAVDGEVIDTVMIPGESIRVALEGDRGELTVELGRDTAIFDQEGRRPFDGPFFAGERLSLRGTWTDAGSLSASRVVVDPDGQGH